MSNGYKLLWSGHSKPENEVGVMVAKWLVENTVEVEKPSARIMKVNVAVGDEVWKVISCYCPKAGRLTSKTDRFCELPDRVVSSENVNGLGNW